MRGFSLSAMKQMLQSKTRKMRVFLFNEVLYHLTKWMQWSLLIVRLSTIPINAPNTWPGATKTSSFLSWSWFLFSSFICTLCNISHKILFPFHFDHTNPSSYFQKLFLSSIFTRYIDSDELSELKATNEGISIYAYNYEHFLLFASVSPSRNLSQI